VTVTELVVVLGMIGVVALGNATFISDFMTQMKKTTMNSEAESEIGVLNIAAVNILKKSAVSFNKLTLTDDNNENFYAYYPDVPLANLRAVRAGFDTRQFTISAGQENRYFYTLQSEESDYDSLVFDPMYAYRQTTAPTDQMTDGLVQYVGINSIPDLSGTAGAAKNGTMTQVFQKRWANGKLFLLSSPTYLRRITSGTIDIMTPPSFPSYLGKVNGTDLTALLTSESVLPIANTNPLTGVAYTNVDDYMRRLPAVGGAAPFVKIEPVTMVRFTVKINNITKKSDLWLQELVGGAYQDKVMLFADIKTVTFKRKAISLPMISLEVIREVKM
jgi:hypothetical protein